MQNGNQKFNQESIDSKVRAGTWRLEVINIVEWATDEFILASSSY